MTRRDRKLLLIGTIALVLVRVGLSMLRSGPVLVADEIGYLMNGRILGGGVAGQLNGAPFYHGGYSLLLAPLLAAFPSPDAGYHLVLVLNGVLVALVFPLLYALLRRSGGVRPTVALGGAFAGALYPSVTVLSQVAMSENLLFPLTCAWLLAAAELAAGGSRHRTGWMVLAVALAGFGYAAHGRMVVAVALTAALMAWLGARRRLPVGTVLAGMAVIVGGLLATHVLDAFLVTHNYGGHAVSETGSRLSALDSAGAVRGAAENLLGQSWSLLAATLGLAAFAAVAAYRELRWARAPIASAVAPAAPLTVALAVGLVLVSAASFPVRARSDMLIYGRYADVAAPALIAVGVAWLAGTGHRARVRWRWPAAAAALTVIVAAVTASDGLGHANRWNVASLPFVTSDLGAKVIVGAAIVAAACAWLLRRAAAARPELAGLLAAALFIPTTAYSLDQPVLAAEHAVYPSGWTNPAAITDAAHVRTVAYDLDRTGDPHGYPTVGDRYVAQWFLPHAHLVIFHGGRQPPPAAYVLSDPGWGTRHPGVRPVAVWRTVGRGASTLWRVRRR